MLLVPLAICKIAGAVLNNATGAGTETDTVSFVPAESVMTMEPLPLLPAAVEMENVDPLNSVAFSNDGLSLTTV